MKSGYFTTILLASILTACAMADRSPAYNISFAHPPGLRTDDYTLYLNGVAYTDLRKFTEAVAQLPAGSRLVWSSGCFAFSEIPLGPVPRMMIPEFKAFCKRHHIRFNYYCGYEQTTLSTKSFHAPNMPFSSGPKKGGGMEAQQWLESQGVEFPKRSFAHWNPSKHELTVRSTTQNLEIVALIVESNRSK